MGPKPKRTAAATAAAAAAAAAAPRPTVRDTDLGLDGEQLQLFRRHQAIVQTQHGSTNSDAPRETAHGGGGGGSTTNTSNGSRARMPTTTDSSGLQLMTSHFDQVIVGIRQRLQQLDRETQAPVGSGRKASFRSGSGRSTRSSTTTTTTSTNTTTTTTAATSIAAADAEIARMHAILRQIDELETEFDKVRRIRDIVKGFGDRLDALESRLA